MEKKKSKKKLSSKHQPWIDARKKFRLSDMHIQMARELGMNPRKFGGLANHKQEQWKEPLPEFIETLYEKRFKKPHPDKVRSIEQIVKDKKQKQAECKARRMESKQETEPESSSQQQSEPGFRKAVEDNVPF